MENREIAWKSEAYGDFYVGQQVNNWLILGPAFQVKKNGKNRKHAPMKCLRCGTIWPERRVDNLISSHSNGCSNCSRGIKKLTPCEWQYKSEKDISEVNTNNLTGKHIGHRYGDLTVLNLSKVDKFGHTFYSCHCANCNNIEDFEISRLTYGNRTRCTKCDNNSSIGETAIAQYLNNNNIPFKSQYTFQDLIGNVHCLRFDFAIINEDKISLIEFQGKQHYTPVDYFGGEEQFIKQQDYDARKRQYCADNNYELIEIPYTDIKEIEKYLKKFLKNI